MSILRVENLFMCGGDKKKGLTENDVFTLRFTPLRPIQDEEWALIDATLHLISEYGAIGGKTVFKPSYEEGRKGSIDECGRKLLQHLKKYGLRIPSDFRVIATVNTFDRAYLFTLGYALQRRFVVIEVMPPEEEVEKRAVIKQLILRGLSKDEVSKVCSEAVRLVHVLRRITNRPLGTGIIVDIAYLAYQIIKLRLTSNVKEAIERAAIYIALPQLELVGEQVREVANELEKSYGYTILAEAVRGLGTREVL